MFKLVMDSEGGTNRVASQNPQLPILSNHNSFLKVVQSLINWTGVIDMSGVIKRRCRVQRCWQTEGLGGECFSLVNQKIVFTLVNFFFSVVATMHTFWFLVMVIGDSACYFFLLCFYFSQWQRGLMSLWALVARFESSCSMEQVCKLG